jgi:acetoin utilization deacetylase AcuC-like enzyme
MPAGSGEREWIAALEEDIVPAAARFEPDLVLISAGFDAHRDDPLAGCTLETKTYGEMTRQAMGLDAPVGAVLEGGYDQAALAECVAETMRALGGASQ